MKTNATLNGSEELEAWKRERNAALTSMDMAYAEKLMPRAHPEVRLMAMHKARYECTEIAPELRQESRKWLESHGLHRLGGLPWSADGSLPE